MMEFVGRIYKKADADKAKKLLDEKGIPYKCKTKGVSMLTLFVESPEKSYWFDFYAGKGDLDKAKSILSEFEF